MNQSIYFDNAATSFPKPPGVLEAMVSYGREIGASAGRGTYSQAVEAGEIIHQTRRNLAKLIGAAENDHIILTFNCTDSLVLAIKGIITDGDAHVITTCMDHNSVLRPLHALQEQLGIEVTYISADGEGFIDPNDVRRAVRGNTKLIAMIHGSNVCGVIQDIKAVGEIARELGITYLVDAAQTAGHLPINVQEIPVDLLAMPGHKGLLGPLGTGALYIRKELENQLQPIREGGTGSRSESPIQPDFLPDRFESGSHNLHGIAGLQAGIAYLLKESVDKVRADEMELCSAFLEDLSDIPGLKVYGPKDPEKRVGVFSVTIEGYEPTELSAILEERFNLLTRPGLHCAPLAHKSLGTLEGGGTTRFSTGPFTSLDEVQYATEALAQISYTHIHI